jgi:hypothetical protein
MLRDPYHTGCSGAHETAVYRFSNSIPTKRDAACGTLDLYHKKVTREFGSANAVVTKLSNSARDAGITDVKFPNISPESLLDICSDTISKFKINIFYENYLYS